MANHIKKIPFPKYLLKNDYELILNGSSITEEGESINSITYEGKCIFSEKTKSIITPEGTRVDLIGKVIIEGDVDPNILKIKSGKIIVDKRVMKIYSCSRPRNPDGTIYSTNFEVM